MFIEEPLPFTRFPNGSNPADPTIIGPRFYLFPRMVQEKSHLKRLILPLVIRVNRDVGILRLITVREVGLH